MTRSGDSSGELLLPGIAKQLGALLPTPRATRGGSSTETAYLLNGADRKGLLPTPRATDGTKGGPNQRGSSGDLMLPSAVARLLPTPAVNDMGAGKTVEAWDDWTAAQKAKHGNGNGHGPSLHIEALRMLPTPTAGDASSSRNSTATRHKMPPTGLHADDTLTYALVPVGDAPNRWGEYADAIARQEAAFGRHAPPPTETAPRGGQRLSCKFDEWLMGLPDGWVTDVPGVTHNEALKLCGNGVVWQQAYAALTFMLGAQVVAA